MKKKTTGSKSKAPKQLAAKDFGPLIAEVRGLIQSARHSAVTTVNTLQVMTNFEIGRRTVEHEQKGATRAEYGKELLKELSARLTEEFGKGFSPVNLSLIRKFFLTWRDRTPGPIFQTASEKLKAIPIPQTVSGKSPFTLSWSHYVLLMSLKNPEVRSFYEIEAVSQVLVIARTQTPSCLCALRTPRAQSR